MRGSTGKPEFVSEDEVKMVGPGHDESHFISVPMKTFFDIENFGFWGVSQLDPDQETCVFSLEEEDDGTALHYYGPADEFYYIQEGEITIWWGKNASNLENSFVLKKGDCSYYPTGYKYKVKNTGSTPCKYFYFMTKPNDAELRL
jgi:mannose-6-phosphate isomerase-like protein (cupin superfamily)